MTEKTYIELAHDILLHSNKETPDKLMKVVDNASLINEFGECIANMISCSIEIMSELYLHHGDISIPDTIYLYNNEHLAYEMRRKGVNESNVKMEVSFILICIAYKFLKYVIENEFSYIFDMSISDKVDNFYAFLDYDIDEMSHYMPIMENIIYLLGLSDCVIEKEVSDK